MRFCAPRTCLRRRQSSWYWLASQFGETREYASFWFTLKVSYTGNTAIIFSYRFVQHHSRPFSRCKLRLTNESDISRFGSSDPDPVANDEVISSRHWWFWLRALVSILIMRRDRYR
jgi:hypothetical protein